MTHRVTCSIFMTVLLSFAICFTYGANPVKFNLLIAPGTLSDNAVTLLWDKQYGKEKLVYEVLINGKLAGTVTRTNFTLSKLTPATKYTVLVRVKNGSVATASFNTISFKTATKGKLYNILDFGAKNDTLFKNTGAIQAAIDACTEGGTVLIPKGTWISGALFLKSNMTLFVEPGAVLKGSVSPEDYLPMILNRFEGWEMKTYASLLNAGTLNRDGSYNVRNLRINGGGTIAGGNKQLGNAMIKANGMRSRGRLILLMNCQDVSISNLTITDPPCWTIHYIYSNNITCHDLNINSTARNGDGIDPDSSTDSYIFNCTFSTGDDCIAVKSGKNPEGFFVGKPTTNVRITDCDFTQGHGISIGSEMSGGISEVLVQDCKAGNLLHGMQIKATKERGGYVKNVTVADCQLLKITILSALPYNNDGEAAPEVPVFENYIFRNIDMTGAKPGEVVMDINGFKETPHHLKNLLFNNIVLPENSTIVLNDAEHVKFEAVKTKSGKKPKCDIKNSAEIALDEM